MKNSKTTIIAEAGVNHNGSIDIAKELIDIAVEAKADIVKFQTFKAEKVVTQFAKKAEYQKISEKNFQSQIEMLKNLELDRVAHIELINYCNSKNISFLSTPFDLESIDLLDELDIPLFKIPSGEITNLPYLRAIGSKGKPVIMSTGMCTMDEVIESMNILLESGLSKRNLTVLHCNTEYPTPFEDVSLRAMISMKKKLGVDIGYSDHTPGIEIPIAAVAMGARVIEKHFTLDKSMKGPDHSASLEPGELKKMIKCIRNIEKALKGGIKKPSKSEIKNIFVVRKSIVAKCKIKKGEKFSNNNLTVKRPGTGISPMKWDEISGLTSDKTYQKDDLIK
mgnify:CR=1 FL=1